MVFFNTTLLVEDTGCPSGYMYISVNVDLFPVNFGINNVDVESL